MPTRDVETLLVTPRFRVVRTRREDPGQPPYEREIIRHPGAVVILPLLDERRVCLIRNRRISIDQELIELPAGTLDPGEDPSVAASRELLEETGFQAESLTPLNAFFLSPGILDERIHLYMAEGLRAGPTRLEPGEEIQNLIVPWDEAIQMALDGRIQDAKSLVGLLYYDRVRR